MENTGKELYMAGNAAGLNLCFDSGKAKLRWKELELTKGFGLHTAFYFEGQLYTSLNAQWKVTLIGEDKLHINISYLNIPLVQSWLLSVIGDNELSWEVFMRVKRTSSIRCKKIGVFLSDKYTHWFHFFEQGEFPQGFNWEDIFLKRHTFLTPIGSYCFGVKPSAQYPGVSFEAEAQGGKPLLQNTNEEIKGRAVQFEIGDCNEEVCYEPGSYKWSSCRIRLLEENSAMDSYMDELKKRLFIAKSFGNDKLKLYFDERQARVYFQGIELTKHFALNTIFYLNGKWYGSSHADWQFVKISEEKLHIVIAYNDIPVVHNWLLTFTGANEFYWDVEMRVIEPVNIEHEKLGAFLSDKYTQWFNSVEEGEFPRGVNWENMPLNYTDSRCFGVKPQGEYPGLLFMIDAQGLPLLQNTNEEFSARAVQFELRDLQLQGSYKQGVYKWGSCRIMIVQEKSLLDSYMKECGRSLLENRAICKDDLKIIFDKGQAKVYWKEVELTKNLGLHTAINVDGSWYDSSRAELQFKKIGQEKIYINIIYKDIPVRQNWLLTFTGQNEFSWELDMEVSRRLQIQHSRVSLFVSDKYTKWFNSSEEGEFPRGFNWQRIVLNQIDSRGFGVKPNEEYPGILFEINAEGTPVLQNTDKSSSGRALQFELKNREEGYYEPGNYKYCSLRVKLIKDESIIDEYISSCKLLPLEQENLYIFGDSEELHNRVAGNNNDFKEKLLKIKQALGKRSKLVVKVGVSRFNFFKTKEIVEFVSFLLGRKISVDAAAFNMFPVQKLYFNFVNYLEEIKSIIKTTGIQLVSVDEGLFDLLLTVSSQANIYNEKKLLRLLGVVSEHAFIGPQTVVIDPHHRCNLNCLHCWIHTPKIKHTEEFLARRFNFELYKQMINDFSDLKVDSILFQGDGEPLLYDKFFDMVRYARSKNIEVIFFTNGLLLDKDIAEEVVKLGVSQIFCSLPAGTDKTYALVTNRKETGSLSKILENLKYLTSVKRQANKIYPKLIMTHVIHTLNHKEILEMAKNDVEIGADVIRFYLIRLDENVKFLQLKPEEVESIKESMGKVKAYLKDKHVELLDTTDFQLNHYEKETGAWSKGVFLNEGCLLGWFFCLIPALGDISLCCHLRTVGYLKEKTFKEIWNSKEYAQYRVQAKYLKDNKDVTFLNGVKLYDEHCEHCDTHQVIRDIKEDLKNYNLDRFV